MGQDDGAIVVEGGTASSAAALLEGTCETFAIDCGFCAKHICLPLSWVGLRT